MPAVCAEPPRGPPAVDPRGGNLDFRPPPCAFPRRFSPTSIKGFPAMAEAKLHRYRSHTCGALRKSRRRLDVRLSGWVHRVRDHGGVLFIDLRDHYGIDPGRRRPRQPRLQDRRNIARGMGRPHRRRGQDAARRHVNAELPTGEIELYAPEIEVLSAAKELPLPVFGEPIIRRPSPAISLPRSSPRDAAHDIVKRSRSSPRSAAAWTRLASTNFRRRS